MTKKANQVVLDLDPDTVFHMEFSAGKEGKSVSDFIKMLVLNYSDAQTPDVLKYADGTVIKLK